MELHVRAVSARSLLETQLFGKQDPYCKLTLADRSQRTRVHDNGDKTPVWNEKFMFPIVDAQLDQLQVEVKNKNFASSELIGECKLPVSMFLHGEFVEQWFKLTNGPEDAGEIKLRIQFEKPEGFAASDAPEDHTETVTVATATVITSSYGSSNGAAVVAAAEAEAASSRVYSYGTAERQDSYYHEQPSQGYSQQQQPPQGYPPQQGYPSQPPGYPTQHPGYPPQQPGYPPQQQGYPPQQPGYPPQQPGYPPQQSGYPTQQRGYPPQQPRYPPQQPGYPPQQQYGNLPQQGYSYQQSPPAQPVAYVVETSHGYRRRHSSDSDSDSDRGYERGGGGGGMSTGAQVALGVGAGVLGGMVLGEVIDDVFDDDD